MSHLHGIGAGSGVEGDSSTSTQLREFFTVLALSLHAVFEGLAVGLEDTTAGVWTLFAAIASHKFVISFCMGVELVSVSRLIWTDKVTRFNDICQDIVLLAASAMKSFALPGLLTRKTQFNLLLSKLSEGRVGCR